MTEWNPYYAAYAEAQGRAPGEQFARGQLWEFTTWMTAAWQQWRALRPLAAGRYERVEEFGHWLACPSALREPIAVDLGDPSIPF